MQSIRWPDLVSKGNSLKEIRSPNFEIHTYYQKDSFEITRIHKVWRMSHSQDIGHSEGKMGR